MMPLPLKDRLRGSLYAGFLAMLLAVPCLALATELCFCTAPDGQYVPGKFIAKIFPHGMRDLVFILLLSVPSVSSTVIVTFFFPFSLPIRSKHHFLKVWLMRSLFIGLGIIGMGIPVISTAWAENSVCWFELTGSWFFTTILVYCSTVMCRAALLRARGNPTRLRNYFLGILSFMPLMWIGACLMKTDDYISMGQIRVALITGAGLTTFMAAGLVDLIRARNVSS